MTKVNVILLFLCFLSTFIAEAQSDTSRVFRLTKDDVLSGKSSTDVTIVSASRSSQTLGELPVTAYVVTHEEIIKHGYTTLVDVLKSVPGMRVSKPGSGIDGETFLMRGLTGNYYCKILINNIPIQNSVSSSIAIAEQLPIAQAERIEIIFGSASAIYGADAMSGVINIITRVSEKSAYAQADIRTGEDGYQHANFMVGGKLGKNKNIVRYNVFGNLGRRADTNIKYDLNNYDPLLLLIDNRAVADSLRKANPEFIINRIKGDYPNYEGDAFGPKFGKIPQQSQLLGFALEYKGLKFDFLDMYRQDYTSLGQSPLIFGYHDSDIYIGDRQHRLGLTYEVSKEKWALTTNASYMRYRYNPLSSRSSNYRADETGRAYRYAASDDIFGEALWRYTPSQKLEYTFGAYLKASSCLPEGNDLDEPFNTANYFPFTRRDIPNDPVFGDFGHNPINFFAGGAFFQALWTPKRWTIIAGLRLDRSTAYEESQNLDIFTFYPRIAALYKISNHLSARATIGRGFKPPSPNNVYTSLAITNPAIPEGLVNYQQVPNTELKSESAGSSELALRGRLSKKIEFDVILYNNFISNRIDGRFVPVDTSKYQNAVNFPGSPLVARTYVNSDDATASLFAFQITARLRDIIPAIQLNADFSYINNRGSETLPDNAGELNDYRMVPRHFLQWNFSFQISQKIFMRVENVYSSSWIARNVTSPEDLVKRSTSRAPGYRATDVIVRYNVSKQLSTFVKVINLWDRGYGGIDVTGFDVDLPYNPQLGRNIQMGINFELN
ncbi:MAG: TonB-dependent receptor [Cytophagales bacterium]|nr:MAG: TonB-dependent receptor [Cytophagales bacterium]TAF59373.1 MAG: TonB-dependent receptor [Cytophagales bacterium]